MENYTASLNLANISNAVFSKEDLTILLQVLAVTSYSITFILGVVGNGLVIWVTGFRLKKTVVTIWFLNLAIADFTFCLILPLYMADLVFPYWPYDQILCKVLNTAFYLNLSVSVILLMTIGIDRCVCILWPFGSQIYRTAKLAIIISVIIWIFSLALSSPYLVFYEVEYDNYSNTSLCYPTYGVQTSNYDLLYLRDTRHYAMTVTRFVAMFLIPFTIILICYILIIFRVKRSCRASESGRTFKAIVTVVLCFFLCWFLCYLLLIMELFNIRVQSPFHEIMFTVADCLACLNSCLNPLIYVFIGKDFKRKMKRSIPLLLENTLKE